MVAFKPEKDEILDGIVSNIDSTGIQVHSGPLQCFIKTDVSTNLVTFKKMGGYNFDHTNGHQYFSKWGLPGESL